MLPPLSRKTLRGPRPARALAFALGGLALLAACMAGVLQQAARAASNFTVNSAEDTADGNPGDGVCDDGAGRCTLRAAIMQANATAGADTITFAIGTGVQRIQVIGGPLPNVSDPVVIDATTQPGYAGSPLVELVGSQAWGISITAGNSAVRGLSVGGFGEGIKLSLNGGNRVEACYVGLSSDGRPFGNIQGLTVASANNVVGGAGKGNVISGNSAAGVSISGAASAGNVVAGNLIGTSPGGAAALPNSVGVELLQGASSNAVGGAEPGARNVISANRDYGVLLSGAGASNAVRGNYIGTNAAGNAKLGAQVLGVWVTNSPGNAVGGAAAGAGNVISGNVTGLQVSTPQPGGTDVQGNLIGTDASGTAAVGNTFGAKLGGQNVTFGGTTPGSRNVVAGNVIGVQILFGPLNFQGNFVGAGADGKPLPNSSDGVQVADITATGRVVIGGDSAGAANTIAFNGGAGVAVKPTFVFDNNFPEGRFGTVTVRGNSIHSNGGLGLDLIARTSGDPREAPADGPTPNDAGDADFGPNGLQNSPALTSVTSAGGSVNVRGTLNSAPGATYTLDFYTNATCDPSGYGEGQAHVGSATLTTDAAGNGAFDSTFAAGAAGLVITATATDAAGNTSEFSLCGDGGGDGSVQFVQAEYDADEQSGTAVVTVTRTLGASAAATVNYATSDGTARAGLDYTAVSGTLSFAAGETTKTFGVPLTNDSTDEETETINLTLTSATSAALGARSTAVLNVADDDAPPQVSFVGDVIVAEGDAGTADAVFTVGLSAPSERTVGVVYFTAADGSADSQDFQAASGTLTFAPGQTRKTFAVRVNGDTQAEPDETFGVTLASPSNARLPLDQTYSSTTAVIWDDDAPGIHFSAPRYSASETDGSVAVRVVRRGDTSAPASVAYSASGSQFDAEGVASQRADFTAASGTLRFAPGETEKSFTVLVNDDAYVEGPEAVSLTLSNPTDAPPNTTYRASLFIDSDDKVPPTPANNPLGNSAFFVRQHYHDFLSREPDDAGLAFWTNEIEKCGADQQCRDVKRINVSAAFFLSIEFQNTGYFVYRTYKAAFGDAVSPRVPGTVPVIRLAEFLADTRRAGEGVVVGQGRWQEQLDANKGAYALEFVQRQRFLDEFPRTLTPAQFVDRLRGNTDAALSQAERDALVAELSAQNTDAGRAAVLRKVAEDEDLRAAESSRAFVLMQYYGYLRRNPDDLPDSDFRGWRFWLDKLNQFNGNYIRAEMVKAFISSTEYRRRFGL